MFWSAGERGDELLLSQADVVLTGTNELDQFGVLPANARIDANQDGADDLIIGAPGAEGLLGGVKQDAGKLHFVYGSPVQLELAAEEDIFVLANRTFTGSGDFLVDLGTGQPDIFELADLNGDFVDDFALQDGEFEKWYRFTTLGDGQAGNAVRLSPAFGAPTAIVSTFDNGASGVIDVNGSNGAMEFDLGIFQGIVIEDGDIAAGTLLLAYDDAIAGNLQVRLVTGEGDGSISGDNVATSTLIDTIAFSSGSGLLEVDLTSTLLNELAVGHTRITLQFVATSGSLDVFSSSADERTRIDVDTSSGPGVLMDVLDADGRRVAEATSVLDMRNLDAGTYHLHVYSPTGPVGADLAFRIETEAPIQGFSHADFDRDDLFGGEGEDILVGNGGLDRMFGESGDDKFIGEQIEVRDLDPDDEITVAPITEENSLNLPRAVDPVIDVVDVQLRAALADALGIAVTIRYDGKSVVAEDLFASDLATLTSLDASNLGITELSGLEWAINLNAVNLSHNPITGLETLLPAHRPADRLPDRPRPARASRARLHRSAEPRQPGRGGRDAAGTAQPECRRHLDGRLHQRQRHPDQGLLRASGAR